MHTVRQLLETKRADVYAVGDDAAVLDALRLMSDKEVGAVLVMRGERLAGIFSERDYARKVALLGRSSASTPVSEIMTVSVMTVTPDASVSECMQLMTDRRIRHLPVVDAAGVHGVISIGDLVKSIIEDQQRDLDQLTQYIVS